MATTIRPRQALYDACACKFTLTDDMHNKTSLSAPVLIEVAVQSQESEHLCICVC